MTIIDRLKEVVGLLEQSGTRYALAGGLAASCYRTEERTTKDIDIIIFTEGSLEDTAAELLTKLNLTPGYARQADLKGGPLFAIKNKSTPVYIVVGRNAKDSSIIGVDFILPTMPWATDALERAQQHRINMGFGELPIITVEDVIIAKLFSVGDKSDRFKDLDDLQSIFRAHHKFDYNYLNGQMLKFELALPEVLEKDAPEDLLWISKTVRKAIRKKNAKASTFR